MTDLPERFWRKTRVADCIVWTGAVNGKGYGCFVVDGAAQLVHRLAWTDAHGPIPDGLTVDHLCRVRNCLNVEHLELVTVAENNRRKKSATGLVLGGECVRGHELTEENVYRHPRGHIECRPCRTAARKQRNKYDRPGRPSAASIAAQEARERAA